MDGIDWDEWIRSDADNISQLRGLRSPQQQTQTQPKRMGEPDMEITENELREMARTPWHDLTANQQRVVLANLCGPGKSTARTGLRDALNMNPTRTAMELWQIQQAVGAGPSTGGHQPDTDGAGATGAPTTPVRWEPGMLVEKLPEDLHHARVVVSDAQKTARAAHEHPGRWVVYGVSDGAHARRIALEKVRRVVRAKTSAFAPAASFEAQAREVEPGRYVVFCRYVGAEQ
ncbi:hypothetical protein [Bifidobacterium pseudolongum]|uniref:hypothetical protein n=1 Tax=Bifidobacterium pseudolongum TaxID=1694 RepID=UPI001F1040C8|nr:hypothetical protein [Bifidobacterium pseudolongum]MCH4857028.1 hypothetical protein [Bifidobacterium pseudolongum]